MEALYEAIKTKFDADSTLASPSGAFTQLYAAQDPPDAGDLSWPFCVVVPGDAAKTGGTFGSIYRRVHFTFHAVDDTFEKVGGYAALIKTAFHGQALAPTGYQVLSLEEIDSRFVQEEKDVWRAELDYEALVKEARP